MSSSIARVAAVTLCAAVLTACGGRPAEPVSAVPPQASSVERCVLVAPPAAPPETVSVAVDEPVAPAHAPLPRNRTERFVFAHMYEPLLQFDCAGTPRGGVAERWTADGTGRVWTITLRSDARFWSGTLVTSADVVAGWGDVRGLGVEAVDVIDDRRIVVTLALGSTAVPRVFASPGLAVRRGSVGQRWPEGTGAYRPDTGAGGAAVYAVPFGSTTTINRPVLVFRRWPGEDPRDPLDGGADLTVTDDAAALAYAATLPTVSAIPIEWDRMYVFVATAPISLDDSVRAALARDAVRVEARAAEPPEWWYERPPCPRPRAAAPLSGPGRVAYPQGDRVARDLAERLVALGVVGRRATAVALETAEFANALQAGREAAYVLPLPRQSPPACDAGPLGPATAITVPLIDTRARAIVRRGAVGLSVGADGTLRLEFR